MVDKKIIPNVPEPLVLTEKLEQKLQTWITYFKNMSPRIIVMTPSDKNFNLEDYENSCKKEIGFSNDPKDIMICSWPQKEQVAFIVCYNSSLPENKPEYLVKNAILFCFYDLAFFLERNGFEQGEKEEIITKNKNHIVMKYYLSGYPNILTWEFNTEILKQRLIDIENSISNVPVQ